MLGNVKSLMYCRELYTFFVSNLVYLSKRLRHWNAGASLGFFSLFVGCGSLLSRKCRIHTFNISQKSRLIYSHAHFFPPTRKAMSRPTQRFETEAPFEHTLHLQ
jgi:restriction endonuclease S subunit